MANRCANCNNIVIEGETYCPTCKALPPEKRVQKSTVQSTRESKPYMEQPQQSNETAELLKKLISIEENTQQKINAIASTVEIFRKIVKALIVIGIINAAAVLVSMIF